MRLTPVPVPVPVDPVGTMMGRAASPSSPSPSAWGRGSAVTDAICPRPWLPVARRAAVAGDRMPCPVWACPAGRVDGEEDRLVKGVLPLEPLPLLLPLRAE